MVDATRLGAWLRSGEGIGWLAAGIIPNSLYRVPFFYLFWHVYFVIVPFFVPFLFCFAMFFLLSLELSRCSSDLFCPADHVPDWQPRILPGMVEARSVNVKKTPTPTHSLEHKERYNIVIGEEMYIYVLQLVRSRYFLPCRLIHVYISTMCITLLLQRLQRLHHFMVLKRVPRW